MFERHVELIAVGVFQHQVLGGEVRAFGRPAYAREPADAMLDVDNVVAGGYLGQEGVPVGPASAGGAALFGDAEYLGVADHHQLPPGSGEYEPVAEVRAGGLHERHASGRRNPAERCGGGVGYAVFGEYLVQAARVGRYRH